MFFSINQYFVISNAFVAQVYNSSKSLVLSFLQTKKYKTNIVTSVF